MRLMNDRSMKPDKMEMKNAHKFKENVMMRVLYTYMHRYLDTYA